MSLSMTGYGQSVVDFQGYSISFEVKSVNHRYCEIVFRMPREWALFEDSLRRAVQSRIGRGRIDVYINKENNGESQGAVLNHAMVRAYLQAAEDLKSYGITGDLAVRDILTLPDVLVTPSGLSMDEAQQRLWNDALLQGLEQALEGLVQMRSREGAFLAKDIGQRLDRLQVLHREMTELAPEVPVEYRKRLRRALNLLMTDRLLLMNIYSEWKSLCLLNVPMWTRS